mmetsp:Transcript_26088/g.29030  ORF Transcript_26088/g.29030 Transcript_26088/m.29030 type:complete len:91 (-) Transcript_26088:498-770(-)
MNFCMNMMLTDSIVVSIVASVRLKNSIFILSLTDNKGIIITAMKATPAIAINTERDSLWFAGYLCDTHAINTQHDSIHRQYKTSNQGNAS